MKKSLFAIAIISALFPLAFSMEANAAKSAKEAIKESITLGPWTGGGNGGVWLNGITLNGPVLQGTSMEGAKLQGMELQNLKVEGGQLVGITRVAGE